MYFRNKADYVLLASAAYATLFKSLNFLYKKESGCIKTDNMENHVYVIRTKVYGW